MDIPATISDTSAILSYYYSQWIKADTLENSILSHASASFFKSPLVFTSVDSVKLNGTTIPEVPKGYFLNSVGKLLTCKWHVKGKNGIPDFDLANETPIYDPDVLIDSLNTSQDITISLPELANTNAAVVTFSGNSFSVKKEVSLSATKASAYFSKKDLSVLGKTSSGTMTIEFWNRNLRVTGAKNVLLENKAEIIKVMKFY